MAVARACYMEKILAPHNVGYSDGLKFNKNMQVL